MRGLCVRSAAVGAEAREGESRGRPMRKFRFMAQNYRPRLDRSRAEAALKE